MRTGLVLPFVVSAVAGVALIGVAERPSSAAAAPDDARARVSDTFTTQQPRTSAGRRFEVDFADPDDPEGKPPALRRVELALHPGSRFDTEAITRCEASDAELVAVGPSACPEQSRVGTNVVVVDTGFPGPARLVTSDFVLFNAADELILLGTTRDGGARVVLRGAVRDNRLTIEIPPLPGTPPDGGANRSERADFAAASGPGGDYLTTPPTCPAEGFWTNRVTYTYADGVRQTAESRSPCVPAGTGGGRGGKGPHGGDPENARLCLPRRMRVTSRRIGPVRVGHSLAGVTRRYRVVRRGPRATRLCVRGGGRFPVADRRGRIDFIASTARRHATRRAAPHRELRRQRLNGVRQVRQAMLIGTIHGRGQGRVVYGTHGVRLDYLAVTPRRAALRRLALARRLRGLGLRR